MLSLCRGESHIGDNEAYGRNKRLSSFPRCAGGGEAKRKMAMRVLQANLNRSRLADDLLIQIIREFKAEVVIISEQYNNKGTSRWQSDLLGTAAIWVPEPNILIENADIETGFTSLQCNNITFFSCYLTPNEGIDEFQQKLDTLEDAILRTQGDVIVAGDLNARAVEWGMPSTNSRGGKILEMAARVGLNVMNEGDTPTFRRPGYSGSIPDITLASESATPKLINWRVIEDFTGSDHQYIVFDVLNDRCASREIQPIRWNVEKMDIRKFQATIERGKNTVTSMTENTDRLVCSTMELINKACEGSMPRKKSLHANKKPVYWWTDEVAEYRRLCIRSRRRATRMRTRGEAAATAAAAQYKLAKKELRKVILRSKQLSWEKLIAEVETDPWGLGYKVVMKKIGKLAPSPLMNAEETIKIADALFPTHRDREVKMHVVESSDIPTFTEEELLKAVSSLKNKKAPGPDGIPYEALKITVQTCSEVLLKMYNKCLEDGVFPTKWKEQRLVLISKGKGDPRSPSAYRPLCMLNTAGKLLERLIKPRLATAIQEAGDLSGRQYGFRCGRSTIDAIREVGRIAQEAQAGNHFSRKIVLLVTLDVKNAFNSARWPDIIRSLEHTFRVPKYLLRMIESYLSNRVLLVGTSEGEYKKKVTAGAAQGSVLGPDLWNAMYDGVLRLQMPEDATLVGFADDVAAIIVARDIDSAQRKLDQVMREVIEWMKNCGLSLATQKTEIVVITRKHIPTLMPIRVGTEIIESSSNVKYLGIKIDTKMTYWCQIQHAADKAAKTTTALSKMMGNIKGPGQNKRRLLMSVTHSIMLYGCAIWADALKINKYRKRMAAVQRRGALRVACSYRTVSEPAVLIIAGIIPIDLLALERKDMHDRKGSLPKHELKQLLRACTMERWQERWREDTRGRWTARLIGDLYAWTERQHGEVNYYLSQFLSGHGYFAEYLCRMGKRTSGRCVYGDADKDDAFHTFFECCHWTQHRRDLEINIGVFDPNNIIQKMIMDLDKWEKVSTYIQDVLRMKKVDLDMNS